MADDRDDSDEEIARRIRQGDAAAANLLFDRHRAELRAAARYRIPTALRGRIAPSDVIQEALLAAYLDLGKGSFENRGAGSFERWLKGVLEHRISEEVRRLSAKKREVRREVRLGTVAAEASVRGREPSATRSLMHAEETAAVRSAVESLPLDYATVLRHKHFGGLTLVETARVMGRSTAAVEKLYGRALARLAEQLRPGGADPS